MKLYCISDMHGDLDGLDPSGYDICVVAGDFSKMTGFGKWHLYDQKKWIIKKFLQWTSRYPETKFVVTPGNHDLCMDPLKTNIYPDLDWKIEWPDNVVTLNDSYTEINGLKIYGTPYIPVISYKWAFEREHDGLVREFSKIPDNLDILITHTPPRVSDSNIDLSIQTGRGPFGSSELTAAIFDKKPKRVFCGHIHTGDHRPLLFENSIIYNISRLNEDYCAAYSPLLLNI